MPAQPLPLLVLASTSRYRRELLARLGLPFATLAPAVDESPVAGETPPTLALRLACAKARAAQSAYPDALIIGCDQVAAVGAALLSKPGSHENAVRQLQLMRGKPVQFFTALCLLNARTARTQQDVVTITVHMRDVTDAQIERYLAVDQPYDCAGSAKIEGLGIALVARFEGDDPSALIGLPLIRLCAMLRGEGVELP
jgi:septum formation protein